MGWVEDGWMDGWIVAIMMMVTQLLGCEMPAGPIKSWDGTRKMKTKRGREQGRRDESRRHHWM